MEDQPWRGNCSCTITNPLQPYTFDKINDMPAIANVRMYNQLNLGDCFLLKFSAEGSDSFLLVDFGSYAPTDGEREREIAANIKETVGDKPLIIVLTHQHQDHLS